MTYIELINAFWMRRMVWPLTSYEADFYFYLLKECNSRNWTNPFKLPTQILERELNLNRRTICEIRNKLIQSGYIDVTPSTKRGEVTEYEIVDISIDPYSEHKPNTNRTQNERKTNTKRTQSEHKANANRTQTEHNIKNKDLDLDKDKEKLSKESKKKEEVSLFGAGAAEKMFDGYVLDYVPEEYYQIFTEWLEYKRKRNQRYKDDLQVKKCYTRLYDLSEGRLDYAEAIINASIANGYQGFFALKPYEKQSIDNKKNGNENNTTRQKDRQGTSVDKSFEDMDYTEGF